MNDQSKTMKERVLAHMLSREELATVMSQEELEIASGGLVPVTPLPPVNCTPKSDPSAVSSSAS